MSKSRAEILEQSHADLQSPRVSSVYKKSVDGDEVCCRDGDAFCVAEFSIVRLASSRAEISSNRFVNAAVVTPNDLVKAAVSVSNFSSHRFVKAAI